MTRLTIVCRLLLLLRRSTSSAGVDLRTVSFLLEAVQAALLLALRSMLSSIAWGSPGHSASTVCSWLAPGYPLLS